MHILITDNKTFNIQKTIFDNILLDISNYDYDSLLSSSHGTSHETIAIIYFISRFGFHPLSKACDCCGKDFDITIIDSVKNLTFNKLLYIKFSIEEFNTIKKTIYDNNKYNYFMLDNIDYDCDMFQYQYILSKYNTTSNYNSYNSDKIITNLCQIYLPSLYDITLKTIKNNFNSEYVEQYLPDHILDDLDKT